MIADILTFAEPKADEMPQAYREKLLELSTLFEIYDEEIALQRRPSAKRLNEADKERNFAIRTMYKVMHTYTHYKYSPEKEVASQALLRIKKSYGSGREIARLPQDSKSAVIINLLQELSTDVAQQYIATLNLTDALRALETNNQIFKREDKIRKKLQAKYVTGVVKHARENLQSEFMEFVTLINALAVVEGQENYADLKQIIGAIVHRYVAKAKLRTKKEKA
ncbi:MAG: DUF6261 family protein [Dysgonamonadaceae bacterium]|nr:DUF6261 family protein [Dysgonamonadaceae bacterium]